MKKSSKRTHGTPITNAVRDKNACGSDSERFVAMIDNARQLEREAAFYRKLLEQICLDPRETRGRRLAESGLIFWDSMSQSAHGFLTQRRKGAKLRLKK